jgi:transposase InsO family protein
MIQISTSTYYYKPKKSRAERDKADADLRDKMEQIQIIFPKSGYRTMKEYLERDFELTINHKKIRRIMGKYGLMAEIKRAFVRTTDSEHGFAIYPNLLKGKSVTGINQVWVSDITYIRIQTGFVYLAVIIDIYSRKVIGWALSKRINNEITISALMSAIEQRKPPEGCMHHSDRGVQYASHDYVNLLKQHKFQISMSRSGNPYDNAFAESFMKTLKKDEVYLWEYETFNDAIERISYFIEEVYNKKRVHSGIGYLPPVEFENLLKGKENEINQNNGQSGCSNNQPQTVQA